MSSVRLGIDVLVESPWPVAGRRIGLITNGSGVTSAGIPTWKALRAVPNVRLVRLFGPEHGLEGGAIYMEAVRSAIHAPVGPAGRLPVRRDRGEPEAAPGGLRGPRGDRLRRRRRRLAVLHLHLDDAARDGGLRRVAAALRRVRPPEPSRRRRRGRAAVVGLPHLRRAPPDPRAARHDGGELARLFAAERRLDIDLVVCPAAGWARDMSYAETGLPWIPPSPNMPTAETALVYPGMCLLEGTNVSEGRGTTARSRRSARPGSTPPR
jgi:hypothetical protein